MEIVETNVKGGEVMIFGHKFYLKTTNFHSNFVPTARILSKNFVG